MQPESNVAVAQLARESTSSIKIERGQRGSYGWEIRAIHEPGKEQEALESLVATDAKLRALFGPEQAE